MGCAGGFGAEAPGPSPLAAFFINMASSLPPHIATRINTSDGRMVLMRKLPDGRFEVVTHVSADACVVRSYQRSHAAKLHVGDAPHLMHPDWGLPTMHHHAPSACRTEP